MEDNIIIMNKKFELFLNTVHYCLWLGDRKFGDFMGKVVNVLLSPIPKYLFTKEYIRTSTLRSIQIIMKRTNPIPGIFWIKFSE